MEFDKPEEAQPVAETIEEASDGTVDHQGLARLVERYEPADTFPFILEASQSFRPAEIPRAKSSPPKTMAIAVIAIVALLGCGLSVFFWTRFSSAPSAPPRTDNRNTNINLGVNNPPGADVPAEMIVVPGGEFQMGRAGGLVQEGPPHAVTVASFAMDKTEVTNAAYAVFLHETNHTPPSHWGGNSPISGQEQMPVDNVSLEDANAFAAWRSKQDGMNYRLPTEEEWEYAARGGDQGNLYPWGNNWAGGRTATKDAGLASPKSVGSYPYGKARWGHLDMIGNVWEWTSSKASYYPGSNENVSPAHANWSIIRGGSVLSDPQGVKPINNAFRDWIAPTTKDGLLGFRLLRDGS